MTHTQQPEALRLAEILDKYALNPLREVAAELRRQHARIAELEAQLSAIGAGGVEPLRKREATAYPAEGVPLQAVELDVDDLIDRLLDAQQYLNLAANVHMDQSIASASTLLDEVEIALRTLATTQPAAQGVEQFIEQAGDVHFQRCRVGSKEGAIRWDIEFGHYGAEVRGKTLREAITKAIAAKAKNGDTQS